jgi:hypothetical protein
LFDEEAVIKCGVSGWGISAVACCSRAYRTSGLVDDLYFEAYRKRVGWQAATTFNI